MRLIAAAALSLYALSGLVPGITAAIPEGIDGHRYTAQLVKRALPNAPNGYTPTNVTCPSIRPSARSADSLSVNETQWLPKRRQKTTAALKDFFGHVHIPGFDAVGYIDKASNNSANVPNVAIAVSGGGYRALMNGAGAIEAFDSRTPNSTAEGHLGGLLQSATYLAGLSGGSWLVGSIYMNNFSTVPELQGSDVVWHFENSIFKGPDTGSVHFIDSGEYYKQIEDAVSGKKKAGFRTSITDYWGRALSYQLINATDGGLNYTWSSIAASTGFQNAEMPMPIVIADERNPGERLVRGNATIFEFNPWEFGSFDPTAYGFIPIEYLGSRFVAGSLPQNESCVRGFDNAGYVMGTSSTLFNEFLLRLNGTDLPSLVKAAARSILKDIGKDNEDIALYWPNPFYHYHNSTFPAAETEELHLVDGGEDQENIPLHPLIQPERHVDVIFAIDSSADTNLNWPNGSALIATYQRSLEPSIANGTVFPAVPGQDTFINDGLNTRPTFFGCDSKNMSGPAPLIVYLPNYPYITWSNLSTFDPSYNLSARDTYIRNGYDVATMGNSTRASDWPTCVGCAILSRSFERTNTTVPDACAKCFQSYCWNGSTNTSVPLPYEPNILMAQADADENAASVAVPSILSILIAVGFAALMV